jgi:hypothetical protein
MILPLSPMEILTLIKGLIMILKEAAQAPWEFVQLQRTLGYVSELLSGIMSGSDWWRGDETRQWWKDCQECLTKTTNYLETHVKVQSDGIIGFYARVKWTFTDAKRLAANWKDWCWLYCLHAAAANRTKVSRQSCISFRPIPKGKCHSMRHHIRSDSISLPLSYEEFDRRTAMD